MSLTPNQSRRQRGPAAKPLSQATLPISRPVTMASSPYLAFSYLETIQ